MKIAYVIGALPFGGVENLLFDTIVRIHRSNAHQCVIINLSGTGVKEREFVDMGIRVVSVGNNLNALASHRLDTLYKLRALLLVERPDVIHTQHFSGDYFGRLAAVGLGIPVITHIHNQRIEKRANRRLMNRLLAYRTDLFVAVSCAVAEMICRAHRVKQSKIAVLYNAIDPTRFDVVAADLSALFGVTGRVIVGVGRYDSVKNFDLLIRAVGLLLERGHNISLLLVGEGGERSHYLRIIDELGIHGNVVLTGYRMDVPAILRSASILVAPSDAEGFLNTHLEAMHCGVPAIITKEVPSCEISEGYVSVCNRSVQGIAQEIAHLLEDSARYEEISVQGKLIAKEYTIDKYVMRLLDLYKKVLSSERR